MGSPQTFLSFKKENQESREGRRPVVRAGQWGFVQTKGVFSSTFLFFSKAAIFARSRKNLLRKSPGLLPRYTFSIFLAPTNPRSARPLYDFGTLPVYRAGPKQPNSGLLLTRPIAKTITFHTFLGRRPLPQQSVHFRTLSCLYACTT